MISTHDFNLPSTGNNRAVSKIRTNSKTEATGLAGRVNHVSIICFSRARDAHSRDAERTMFVTLFHGQPMRRVCGRPTKAFQNRKAGHISGKGAHLLHLSRWGTDTRGAQPPAVPKGIPLELD